MARAVDGLFLGTDVEVSSVAIDSRDVVPGALFVALPGERTDGGRFVPEAFANGAAGAWCATVSTSTDRRCPCARPARHS